MPKGVPPRFILTLWPAVDRLLRAIYQIRPLRGDDSSIIRFNLRRYKGPVTVLNDGSRVKTGDTIIELHLNNDWFRRRRKLNLKASQSPREFLAAFAHDLRFLAEQVNDGAFGNITALHGSTILDIAARRLGFQVNELPDNLWKKGARFYMAGLLQVYHLRGGEVLELKEKTWELKEVWLSRAALMSSYGPKHP
ncbi:MAG: YkoP family protein [Dehalococcoidia bacterium]